MKCYEKSDLDIRIEQIVFFLEDIRIIRDLWD